MERVLFGASLAVMLMGLWTVVIGFVRALAQSPSGGQVVFAGLLVFLGGFVLSLWSTRETEVHDE